MYFFLPFLLLISSMVFAAESPGSYGKLGRHKAIFNMYDRTRNTDPSLYENRIVGQIGNHCTGTLIGPSHVLTAAHCIYDIHSTNVRNNLSFTPGRMDKGFAPFKTIGWKRIYLSKKFDTRHEDYSYDFAVIELKEEIGSYLGWAGYKVLNEANDLSVSLRGYPHDKEEGSQWRVTCPAHTTKNEVRYLCDTFSGMSGSAVISSSGFIKGIHVFSEPSFNAAVKITTERFHMISSWTKGKASKESIVINNR